MRTTSLRLVLAGCLFATSPSWAASGAPVLVDTCGQIVPAKAAAHLAADLDCSAAGASIDISLGKKATLDLAGHTLTTGASYGIRCDDGRCAIRNGMVTGAAEWGGIVGTRMRVENTTIAMSGRIAASLNENSTLRSSTVNGTAFFGIHQSGSKKKVKIINSTIGGHRADGVVAYRVELVGSTVTGNGTDPDCAMRDTCADLLTDTRPKLKASSCGRSQTLPVNPTPGCLGWCLCSDD